jgi:hypothetical protein
LIAPVLPSLDEGLRPCTILSDYLGKVTHQRAAGRRTRIVVGTAPQTVANVLADRVFVSDALPPGAESIAADELSGASAGWELKTKGSGLVIVLGMSWEHRKQEQSTVLGLLLNRLNVQPVVQCTNPNIWTVLRVSGDKAMIFMINLFTAPMKAEIAYTARGGSCVNLGLHTVPAMSVLPLEISH